MKADKIVEKFGENFINGVWDRSIEQMEMVINGKMKSEECQIMHKKIDALNDDTKKLIKEVVISTMQFNTFHVLNFFEEEENYIIGFKDKDKIIDIKELSDGLAGELYSEEGWIEKYSKI